MKADELNRIVEELLPVVPVDLGDHGVRAWTRKDMLRAIATGYLASLRDAALPVQEEV